MTLTGFSQTSTPALYLSNWKDAVAIWKASKLAQTDTSLHPPGIRELHYLGGNAPNWSVNQIVDFSAFFRDDTSGMKYTDSSKFETAAWFESDASSGGTLTAEYRRYVGLGPSPRCTISRQYVFPPTQAFIVSRTVLQNQTEGNLVWNVLDQLHVNNTQAHSGALVHAWYDAERNALFADMSASGQYFLVLGAFQPMNGFQCGDENVNAPADQSVAAWYSFDNDGTLPGNLDLHAIDVDLAFQKSVTLDAGKTTKIDLYLAIAPTRAAAEAASDLARAQTADQWFAQTAAAYAAWLQNGGKGQNPQLTDGGLNTLFTRELFVIKNAQNPVLGTFPATTSPFAYGYKNWVRDGSVTAIALDAAGHHDEAESYYRWMASVQGSDGAWKTTYNYWDGAYLSFVEPEYDSIGSFIYGVFRHFILTGDSAFMNAMWPTVKRAADFILRSLSPVNGFGGTDFSIWEEPERGLEHNVYTQAWYVLGLYATQAIAEFRGDLNLAEWYAGGVASIMTSMQRPSGWFPPGLWNLDGGYYNRGVNQDNSVQPLQDSASNVLVAFGVIDHESQRAASHVDTMTRLLTHDRYGLARYPEDNYYFSSRFNPAGDEVGALEPSWPQMSMWVAAFESIHGQKQEALRRLRWFASTSGIGYMPHGEAVSNVTGQSVLSSMSEPLTAASFVLANLVYTGRFDLRILPPIYNGGARVNIAIHPKTSGDWPQWENVPYFVGTLDAQPKTPLTTIKRLYIANDDDNLYLRIDNVAGHFSAFQAAPVFAFRLYGADLSGGNVEVTRLGLDGSSIGRPVSFAVSRDSDENVFRCWRVQGAAWTEVQPLSGVLPPQWEAASGRLEAIIPFSAMSSGNVMAGSWANVMTVLAFQNKKKQFVDDGRVMVHYRISGPADPWMYGNIETKG
jgi:GH15 family glucan-1,4-alpha-glucosidase